MESSLQACYNVDDEDAKSEADRKQQRNLLNAQYESAHAEVPNYD